MSPHPFNPSLSITVFVPCLISEWSCSILERCIGITSIMEWNFHTVHTAVSYSSASTFVGTSSIKWDCDCFIIRTLKLRALYFTSVQTPVRSSPVVVELRMENSYYQNLLSEPKLLTNAKLLKHRAVLKKLKPHVFFRVAFG